MIVTTVDDASFASADALLPVVIRDVDTAAILTLAWANREALMRTLESKETWLYSRSRSELWNKGATSGNTQRVVRVLTDCDRDALIYEVHPRGPACHDGSTSCFADEGQDVLALGSLRRVIEQRERERPEGSYTTYLFDKGLDKILKKIGEEASEVIIAAKGDDVQRVIEEVSDLVYHLSVLLVERGIELEHVERELRLRAAGRSE